MRRVLVAGASGIFRQHDLDIKVIRISNPYEPKKRPHDGRVVSKFIVQALKVGRRDRSAMWTA